VSLQWRTPQDLGVENDAEVFLFPAVRLRWSFHPARILFARRSSDECVAAAFAGRYAGAELFAADGGSVRGGGGQASQAFHAVTGPTNPEFKVI